MRWRALLLGPSLLLAACAGGAQPATPAPGTAGGGAIQIKDFSFQPQRLEVVAGTTVTWTNTDSTEHTASSGTPGSKDGTFDHTFTSSAKTFSFTFSQPGTFTFFCAFHTTMRGEVVVK